MKSEPLNIKDETFLINRLIQQAPRSTLIREFFKNAEENAALTPQEQPGRIRIYPTLIDGVRKLTFWNTGIGMNETELRIATDISSSIEKTMSLDGNFGIGAKVSGLAVSSEGIRYRSCKNSIVSEVTIGYDKEQEKYVRFAMQLEDVSSDTVVDVTQSLVEEGRDKDLECDWTEAVLMGEAKDHDTVSQPLEIGKNLDRSYIPSEIFRRFADFPKNVQVKVDVAMTKGGRKNETGTFRTVKPLTQILGNLTKYEDCKDEETNIKIRYIHDKKVGGHTQSSRMIPAVASTTFCAIVHKGERYDYKTKQAWSSAAPNFGIPFGSKVLTIEILLPDNIASPNQYRDGLTDPSDRSPVVSDDFCHLVRELMPAWVKKIIQSESPKSNDNLDDVETELQKLLNEFRIPTPTQKEEKNSGMQRTEDSDMGIDKSRPTSEDFSSLLDEYIANDSTDQIREKSGRRAVDQKLRMAPKGSKLSKSLQALERVPAIKILEEEEAIQDKGVKGRAAKFYKESHEIFVNGLYSAVDRMTLELEAEFAGQGEPEDRRTLIARAARRSMAYRVGKAVCFAISKRIADDWNADDLDRATSPESLSLAADDFRTGMNEAKKYVKTHLKIMEAGKKDA